MAVYTIDEGSMELVVQLPINFPLGPVNVDSGKKVGVTAAQWRTWMLQLTTFLQVCVVHNTLAAEIYCTAQERYTYYLNKSLKVWISYDPGWNFMLWGKFL